MKKLLGKDVAVYLRQDGAYIPVAVSTSCELQLSADMVEVSSAFSGRAKKRIAGRYDWQITCQQLVAVGDGTRGLLVSALKSGTPLRVRFEADDTIQEGDALCSSFQASGALGSMATYSVTLMGAGGLM